MHKHVLFESVITVQPKLFAMKILWIFLVCSFSSMAIAQEDSRITSLDFVQVLNENHAEALYYYQQNWQKLRETALVKNYIHAFQLLQTEPSEEAPFHFILITTYANAQQFEKREEHFGELIKERGKLKLLNAKEPGTFRKILFSKEESTYIATSPY